MLLDWKGFPLAGTSVTQPIHCRALLATKELKISLSFAQSLCLTALPALQGPRASKHSFSQQESELPGARAGCRPLLTCTHVLK